MSGESSRNRWPISESLLIAAAIPFSYALAYSYELGYAKHFAIPAPLISITVENCVMAGASLAGLSLFLVSGANIVEMLRPRSRSYERGWLAALLIVVFNIVALCLTDFDRVAPLLAAFIVLSPLSDFILPFAYRSKGQSYDRAVSRLEAEKRHVARGRPIVRLYQRIIRVAALVTPCALLTLSVEGYLGSSYAAEQTQYSVTADGRWVLLARYGDSLVFAALNPKSRELVPVFNVQHVGDLPLELHSVQMGPFAEIAPQHP